MFRFTCVLQNDETDCGPACLATIFKKYGLKVSIAKLRDIAGTDRQGTSAYGLMKATEHFGFQCKVIETTERVFEHDLPLPAIAHIVVNKTLLHYVVIVKASQKEIVVADPAKGMVKYKAEDFFKIWTKVLILVAPTKLSEKGNKKESTLLSFFRLLLSQKWLMVCIFLLSLILTLVGIATSFYYQIIMDYIVPYSSNVVLNYVSLVTLGLFLVNIGLSFFRGLLVAKLEQKLDIPLMLGYYNHTLYLPMNFYSLRNTGEIISRFNDASSIRSTISQASLTIMMDTIMAIIGGVILFNSNKVLFLISIIMLLLYAFIVFIYNKPIKKNNRETMEMSSKVTSLFVESINGIETIKLFNQEENTKIKTEKFYMSFLKKVLKGDILFLTQQTATMVVAIIGELVILWVGAINVMNGSLTLGELITFNALLAYFINPIKNLLGLQPNIQNAVVAADRLGEILDVSPEWNNKDCNNDELDFKKIVVSHLNFRYGTRKLALKNLSFEIAQGEKIAFVGESGSGKTTLAKILVRLYEQESGIIKLGSYDVKDLSINQIRANISYVSQSAFLFTGTIKENLLFGNREANDEELSKVCRMCELEDYIKSLPLGYNSLIEENGKNLSAGQRQRMAIARALLRNPKVLIMDEATSNLDYITEAAINRTINSITSNIIVIIIAHRLNTIKNCDKIFVLKNGEIIENGNHQELIKMKGYYNQLFNGELKRVDMEECYE